AAVIGTTSVVVVPRPGSVVISTAPPSDSSVARTASMPTPRPEISDTSAAVESPGSNTSAAICSAERSTARSGWTTPDPAALGHVARRARQRLEDAQERRGAQLERAPLQLADHAVHPVEALGECGVLARARLRHRAHLARVEDHLADGGEEAVERARVDAHG